MPSPPPSPGHDLRLLHEDAHLVALDKPPGLLTVPGRSRPAGEACLKDLAQARFGRVWAVHRLDRDTSGVVLLARSAAAHHALSLVFEGRQVEKTYLALVLGGPPDDEGLIDLPLHLARKGKSRPAEPGEPGAREARTRYRVLERLPGAAFLELRLETGRHHQARVHLRALGCPLLLDPLYATHASATGTSSSSLRNSRVPSRADALPSPAGQGLRVLACAVDRSDSPRSSEEDPVASARVAGLARTPLHAARLALPHPDGAGRTLVLEAPLPEDLRRALEALRRPRGARAP